MIVTFSAIDLAKNNESLINIPINKLYSLELNDDDDDDNNNSNNNNNISDINCSR